MVGLAAALAVPALAVPAPAAAAPAGVCTNAADPGTTIRQTPWAQRLLAIQRLRPLTVGSGITVAVIDSGVDATHPQLVGHVLRGYDYLRNVPGGNLDCVSHGTAVASLIAAQHTDGIGFEGLAPGVTILPVRVSDHEDNDQNRDDAVSPQVFANSIRYAADSGAKIINISLTLDADFPAVAQAIRYAQDVKGCLIVASVGNHHTAGTGATPSVSGAGPSATSDPPSYPAAYPGVLGVGAIDESGKRLDESQVGPYVDLVAPGGNVLAATRVRGYGYWSGTSMAAPLVSAAAALVWSAHPSISNVEVMRRLTSTADPMAGANHGSEYGYGLVDPYRALTEQLPAPASASPAPIPTAAVDPAAVARAAEWHHQGQVALIIAGIAVLVAAGGAMFAVALRRGRLRDWRPGNAPPPPAARTVEEPEAVFFALPDRDLS
jgi:type VII secretion-associated serine protease mycosin